MMMIGHSKRIMGALTMSRRHRIFGRAATVVMGIAVVAMFVTS